MYIRRTKSCNTLTGESYFTHRLVRSERIEGKVRQYTLFNLGRHFAIPQEQWPTLCARIEELLRAQSTLLPLECTAAMEREAQRCVAQLLVRQSDTSVIPKAVDAPLETDMQTVDINSLEFVRARTVGVEALALWAMRQVDFIEKLTALGLSGPMQAAILGEIVGRMAAPASELATHGWLMDHSGLGELLDVDFETMSLSSLYRASDALMKHRASIETSLFGQISDLFGFTSTVTLIDLTNTYFEGEEASNPKAKRGHSKEKRSDCPLVTLGLVLDGCGFVRRSRTFEGNVVEGKTLEEMLRALDAPAGATVVMDRGVATEDNLKWLRTQGYRYLVMSRERQRKFDSTAAFIITTASGETIQAQRVLSEDGREVRLICYSEGRARKEQGISQRFGKRFEAGLTKLAEGLTKPRCTKRIDKLWERIGRLKQKSHGAGQHYKIEIIPDESGKKATAIQWRQVPMDNSLETDPGIYCLRSNEIEWDAERLWRTYIMLTDLEAVFRSLKSELGLRPVFHHKETRSDGHLFITVLAYQFAQILRHRLHEHGITGSWNSLRKTLSKQQRITAVFRRADGRTLHVRKTSRAEPAHLEIYRALGVNPSPGNTMKMIV
ncbi:transposase [Gammaproteobacteria bacterium]